MKYWAFISYRHADDQSEHRKWASWLQNELENYEIPAELIGEVNEANEIIPPRMFPIFRDKTELSADVSLSKSIQAALRESKYLIVLCSPMAAASKHVADEINYFKTLGRKKNIVPVIISGDPLNASVPCFPDSLLDDEVGQPLAADFRTVDGSEGFTSLKAFRRSLEETSLKDRKKTSRLVDHYEQSSRQAKLMIIATILGVPFEALFQRDKIFKLMREQRKSRVLQRWLMIIACLGAISSGLALIANQQRIEANLARADAEGLVDFLQSDAHAELSSLGRLDIMERLNGTIYAYLDDNRETLSGFRQRVISRVEFQQGQSALKFLDFESAREHFQSAIVASQAAVAIDGRDDWLDMAAISNVKIASIELEEGYVDDAIARLVLSGELADRVLSVDINNAQALNVRYEHLYELALVNANRGEFNTARDSLRELISWFEARRQESGPAVEPDHILLLVQFSRVSSLAGDQQDAFMTAFEASELSLILADSDASNAVIAEADMQLARMHQESGNFLAAKAQLERALVAIGRRISVERNSFETLQQGIEATRLLAVMQLAMDNRREAKDTLEQRSEFARSLRDLDSRSRSGTNQLLIALIEEADLMYGLGEIERAHRLLNEIEDLLEFGRNIGIFDADYRALAEFLAEVETLKEGLRLDEVE